MRHVKAKSVVCKGKICKHIVEFAIMNARVRMHYFYRLEICASSSELHVHRLFATNQKMSTYQSACPAWPKYSCMHDDDVTK